MKNTFTRSITLTLAALTCGAGVLLTASPVLAAAPSAVAKAPATLTAKVTVPKGGAPVTYTLKGKKVTINPGESAAIPVGAKNIKLPAGTLFTVTRQPAKKGAAPSSNTYKLAKAVTLRGLSTSVLKAQSAAFELASQAGNIKLPSGTMVDLMVQVERLRQDEVNAFGVLPPSDVTDGN